MNSEEFRKLLVKMVKASGHEIIDRAEDIVGNGNFISDFNIRIKFPTDGRMLSGVPTIEITREYLSKECMDVLLKEEDSFSKSSNTKELSDV